MENHRVLILVENLPVPFDRRVWMEATTLTQAGYGVSVICPKGQYPKSHEILEGISIYRYGLPSLDGMAGHFLEYAIALPVTFLLTLLVFFREGFDVIQSANPPDFFCLIGAFFKLFGKKFVFDHHDLMPEICDARWTGWKHKLMRALSVRSEWITYRVADGAIATNESYKHVAVTRDHYPAEKINVVRSGPRLNRFKQVEPNPALRNGHKYLAAYLGVMGHNDGIDYLLKAIDHMVHGMGVQDVQFILIGSGDLQPRMKEMSQEMGLEDFVRFPGRIPDEQVREILSTADICLAPDPVDPLNDVSTMNKIIEFMAMGKPIVSFDLKETRISAENAAVYARGNDVIEFAQKAVALLQDPDLRHKMGQAGRKRFETALAWEHQEVKLLDFYANLLQSHQNTELSASKSKSYAD